MGQLRLPLLRAQGGFRRSPVWRHETVSQGKQGCSPLWVQGRLRRGPPRRQEVRGTGQQGLMLLRIEDRLGCRLLRPQETPRPGQHRLALLAVKGHRGLGLQPAARTSHGHPETFSLKLRLDRLRIDLDQSIQGSKRVVELTELLKANCRATQCVGRVRRNAERCIESGKGSLWCAWREYRRAGADRAGYCQGDIPRTLDAGPKRQQLAADLGRRRHPGQFVRRPVCTDKPAGNLFERQDGLVVGRLPLDDP